MKRDWKSVVVIIVCTVIVGSLIFFGFTPTGKTMINEFDNTMKKVDDVTKYGSRKKVEDTCRASITSYKTDRATFEQYIESDNELEKTWAIQAKMRANKTANIYNEYILKNSYVFENNVPSDIYAELELLK